MTIACPECGDEVLVLQSDVSYSMEYVCHVHGSVDPPFPNAGDRVRLTRDVERYPHFIAPKGATGTVIVHDDGLYAVKLDEHLPGAEEWENEVHWYLPNEDDPRPDVEVLP